MGGLDGVPRFIHNPAKDLLLADSVAAGGFYGVACGALSDVSKYLDTAWVAGGGSTARTDFAGGVASQKTTVVNVYDQVKADVDAAWRCEPDQVDNPAYGLVLPIGRHGAI